MYNTPFFSQQYSSSQLVSANTQTTTKKRYQSRELNSTYALSKLLPPLMQIGFRVGLLTNVNPI